MLNYLIVVIINNPKYKINLLIIIMSEDEYKELYLKYKVKYINLKSENNLKNNNQSGGGLFKHAQFILIDEQINNKLNIDKPDIEKYVYNIYKILEEKQQKIYNINKYQIVNDLRIRFMYNNTNLIKLIESANSKFSFTKTKYTFTLDQLYEFLKETKESDITLENFKSYLNDRDTYLTELKEKYASIGVILNKPRDNPRKGRADAAGRGVKTGKRY